MNIFINGKSFTINIDENETPVVERALMTFLNTEQQQTTFAVALNSNFVGRGDYSRTAIKAGDSIDILFPIQGG